MHTTRILVERGAATVTEPWGANDLDVAHFTVSEQWRVALNHDGTTIAGRDLDGYVLSARIMNDDGEFETTKLELTVGAYDKLAQLLAAIERPAVTA